MTAERIRAAARTVNQHGALMLVDIEQPDGPVVDIGTELAALLLRMADSIAQVEHLFDPAELEMPEYVALLALVEAIEGAG